MKPISSVGIEIASFVEKLGKGSQSKDVSASNTLAVPKLLTFRLLNDDNSASTEWSGALLQIPLYHVYRR